MEKETCQEIIKHNLEVEMKELRDYINGKSFFNDPRVIKQSFRDRLDLLENLYKPFIN